MKLTDYQHLESLAAKRGAILVQAADLLAWREEIKTLRSKREMLLGWAKPAWKLVEYVVYSFDPVPDWVRSLYHDAPAELKS